jgi:probable rRNA maturation factor
MNPVLLNNDTSSEIPSLEQFENWVNAVIQHHGKFFQVSIEIVDKSTSQELNNNYRQKNKATNVLSFPLELPEFVEENLIGDLAICAQVVTDEANQQNKAINNHWAHLTIHGCLHLLGYDHIEDDDAQLMEGIEIQLLKQLGIENPY